MERSFKYSHIIEDYEKRIEDQKKDILKSSNFLNELKSTPFKISRFETGFTGKINGFKFSMIECTPIFYTEDYSVITNFKIKKRNIWNDYPSGVHPRDNLSNFITESGYQKYFEFFGKFKEYKIILENPELINDGMDVLYNYNWKKGVGERIDYVFSKDERINYFKSKKMRKNLINKIINEIKNE